MTRELVQLVKQIYNTPKDPRWEECYAKAMTTATCERIELAKQQEKADEASRIAEDEREHKRSMEQMQALGSVLGGVAGTTSQQPNQATDSYPAQPYAAQPQQSSSGATGHGHVAWNARGVVYGACVQVAGSRGQAAVFDQAGGVSVVQDLVLDVGGGTPRWVGSNPRDARTGALASAYYSPDVFVLAQSADGNWSIGAVCDLTGYCSPAQTLQVNH